MSRTPSTRPSSRVPSSRSSASRGASSGSAWPKWAALAVAVVALIAAVRWWTNRPEPVAPAVAVVPGAPVVRPEIVASMPHDTAAFTQGLFVERSAPLTLVETTGLEGRSGLRRVDVATGRVEKRQENGPADFGEGAVRFGDRIYQLTWQQQRAYVYDAETWAPLDTLTYAGEGWGLTTDGTHLVMSNGTSDLVWRDPATFNEVRRVRVMNGQNAVGQLNELEWIDGKVWANVWQTDVIAVIDPATGAVERFVDLAVLRPLQGNPRADVLNGIAFDSASRRLFVTGKFWGSLYEIRVPSASASSAPAPSQTTAPAAR